MPASGKKPITKAMTAASRGSPCGRIWYSALTRRRTTIRRSRAFAYAEGRRSLWKKRRTSICKTNEYAPRKPNFSTSQKLAGLLVKRGLQSTAVQHTASAAVVRKTGNRASILTGGPSRWPLRDTDLP